MKTVGQEMMNNRFQGSAALFQDTLLRKASEFYFDRLKIHLQKFVIEGFEILAENEDDAEQIYKIAKEEK